MHTPESVATFIHQLVSGYPHRIIEHAEARTAEEAALARGTPLSIGGKSLLMKLDRGIGFAVLAIPGDRRVDNRALRQHLRVRRYRFATPEELLQLTGLAPGCVPPLGTVFQLPLFVDSALASTERIAFSAGSRQCSVFMSTADWLTAARPDDVFPFVR